MLSVKCFYSKDDFPPLNLYVTKQPRRDSKSSFKADYSPETEVERDGRHGGSMNHAIFD